MDLGQLGGWQGLFACDQIRPGGQMNARPCTMALMNALSDVAELIEVGGGQPAARVIRWGRMGGMRIAGQPPHSGYGSVSLMTRGRILSIRGCPKGGGLLK